MWTIPTGFAGDDASKTNRLVMENSSIMRSAAAASTFEEIRFGERVMTSPAFAL